MQQITDWLEKLGMSEYADRFAENRIDFSVLPDVTDQDLEKLGVLLGDRRKMLRAIAKLEALDAPIAVATTTPATPRSVDTAERRQVTVMFSDLVGSTALSARMDPEDLREVISAYQKGVAETVGRFGGFVAKYMGDGVLVYFGYPQAHEDDAERAVRSGLELVAAVGALKTHASLRTRVGIATGLVVVGDLIGSGASQEQAIVGETPNLAARLQSIAEPNGVVIAESTRKLVGNFFELQDLGAQELKGVAGPVRSWVAVRPSSVESRFDALHTTGLTELVGREEELRNPAAALVEGEERRRSSGVVIWRTRDWKISTDGCADGAPRSRASHATSLFLLTAAYRQRVVSYHWPDGACRSVHLWRRCASEARQTRYPPSAHASRGRSLLAELLSLPNDGRYPTLQLDPQQRRQKTLEALTAQMEALSRINPVLMIFEDVHWIDPTSLEVLGRTVERLRTGRIADRHLPTGI